MFGGIVPAKSKAQLKWAYWTASGRNPDTPASVGKEFIQATPKAKRRSLMLHHKAAAKGFRQRAKDGYV